MLNPDIKKVIKCIVIGFIAFLFVIFINHIFSDILSDWELKTYDYRMNTRGQIEINPHIALIEIDDRSLNSIGKWPWDRSIHAKMIEILTSSNARTIAYNILFHNCYNNESEDLLIRITRCSERIIFPIGIDSIISDKIKSKSEHETPLVNLLKQYGFDQITGRQWNTLLSAKNIIAPFEEMIVSAKGLGHIYSNRDRDGLIRRVPLIVKLNDILFPSFALVTVMDYLNISKEDIIIRPGRDIVLKDALSPGIQERRDIIIPIDNNGMMLINYAGKWSETFCHYSFSDILNINKVYTKNNASDIFKDNILIVGNIASGYNIKPVPLENSCPGEVIHANIINTILTEKFLKRAGFSENIVIIFVLSILGASILLFNKWYSKIIFLFLSLFGYIIINVSLFVYIGLVLPVLLPILGVALGSMIAIFYYTYSEGLAVNSLTNMNQELEKEKQGLKKELEIIFKKLTEKNKESTVKSPELTKHSNNNHQRLEEKLITDKGKVFYLEDKKIKNASKENSPKYKQLSTEAERYNIITVNKKLLEAFNLAKKVAPTNHTVLLLGESGTGKELFAKAIHEMSQRKDKKFLIIDVNTIPSSISESEFFGHVKNAFTGANTDKKGLFQEAKNGTIFLDEIGNLNCEIQSKLLRVLEEKVVRPVGGLKQEYVDVRIISATDKNLTEKVKADRFNKALFARIKRYPIILPPLRERIEDIPHLVNEFIKRHRKDKNITGISQEAIEIMCKYSWPDNIRQLEDVIIRSIINTQNNELKLNDIQYAIEQESYKGYDNVGERDLEDVNARYFKFNLKNNIDYELIKVLRENQFKFNNTAQVLNMNRNTLRDYFKGIGFKYLIEYNINFHEAALAIGGDPIISKKIEKKIRIYYSNFISNIKDCADENVAKYNCKKIYKNIPQKYFCNIESLVDNYFLFLKKNNRKQIEMQKV